MQWQKKVVILLTVGATTGCAASIRDDVQAEAPDWVLQHALDTATSGQPFYWQDPPTGRKVVIQPIGTFRDSAGNFCRDYQTYEDRAGARPEIRTACQLGDLGWRPVDPSSVKL
jgi:surface antigen